MPSKALLALTAAIVLTSTLSAFAATTRGRAAVSTAAPAIITDACQPVGPPCRTHPDGW
jgi:hypothetical protein